MTKLAICRKCRKVFFTKLKTGNLNLRCRHCGSRKVVAWSSRMINVYGTDLLHDLFPKTVYELPKKPADKKEPISESKDLGTRSKKAIPAIPKRPDAAPGCWGKYDGGAHCKKKCPEFHGKNIQTSCRKRKQWDERWGN